MKFFQRRGFQQHNFRRELSLLTETPLILIAPEAYSRMWHYVDIADDEVGWLGTVKQSGHKFLIKEVFLFKQQVSGATCEITSEGLAEFASEILARRTDGMEVINSLQFWGHSHVRMSTDPSQQDDDQMEIFRESGHSFFIRAILNKNGRLEFTVYFYDSGLKIADLDWSIYQPVDEELRTQIEAEFKDKVKTFGGNYSRVYDYNNFPEVKQPEPGGLWPKQRKKGGYHGH